MRDSSRNKYDPSSTMVGLMLNYLKSKDKRVKLHNLQASTKNGCSSLEREHLAVLSSKNMLFDNIHLLGCQHTSGDYGKIRRNKGGGLHTKQVSQRPSTETLFRSQQSFDT